MREAERRFAGKAVSTVPLDLFDGQPLRYRKLPKGYAVYSIGRDLTDDGGKEASVDPKPDDRYDVTFTVERPE